MDQSELLLAGLGLLCAGVVKGLTGIGFSTCALPFLVAAVGLEPAMALVTIPAIVSNLAIIASSDQPSLVARRFWPFYAAIAPGIVLGVMALSTIGLASAVQLLAVMTLAYVGLALARPDLALPAHFERILAVPAGCLNGFLTGLTGSQIMPLMPYMMSLKLDPGEQVQAINLAVTLASAMMGVALFGAGIMTKEFVLLSAIGSLPAILGVTGGAGMRRWLSPGLFRYLALAVLAILALSLYGRAGIRSGAETCVRAAHAAPALGLPIASLATPPW
jgi:uncharacterized protein